MGQVTLPVQTKLSRLFIDAVQTLKYSFESPDNLRILTIGGKSPKVAVGVKLIEPPLINIVIDSFNDLRFDDGADRSVPMNLLIDYYYAIIDRNINLMEFYGIAGKMIEILREDGIRAFGGLGTNPIISGNFVKTVQQIDERTEIKIATFHMDYKMTIETALYLN